jgi:dTDP-4-dehydrorhamnose reductase
MSLLRVLVTGKQGQLVRSLLEVGPARGIEIVAVGRPELELTDPRSVSAVIAAQRPAVLVHAAGYTDTEHAEVEPELAHAINVDGAAAVAAAARALAVPVIHLSSAYVFDGTSGAAYREDAGLHPLGVYGRTKALGEAAVVAAQPDHVILRASMVFSPFGRNTLTNLLKRTEQRDALEVVADQRLNPTSALDLAGAIVTIAANLAGAPSNRALYGVFHLAGRGVASPAEFAEALFAHSSRYGGPTARVIRVRSEAYPSRVRRPLNALLDCARIAAAHGIALPSWEEPLRHCVERLLTRP